LDDEKAAAKKRYWRRSNNLWPDSSPLPGIIRLKPAPNGFDPQVNGAEIKTQNSLK
jgi:hypothetical protein